MFLSYGRRKQHIRHLEHKWLGSTEMTELESPHKPYVTRVIRIATDNSCHERWRKRWNESWLINRWKYKLRPTVRGRRRSYSFRQIVNTKFVKSNINHVRRQIIAELIFQYFQIKCSFGFFWSLQFCFNTTNWKVTDTSY